MPIRLPLKPAKTLDPTNTAFLHHGIYFILGCEWLESEPKRRSAIFGFQNQIQGYRRWPQSYVDGRRTATVVVVELGQVVRGEGMNSNGVGDSHLGVQELNSYRRDHFYRLDCGNGPYEFGHVQLNNQCDLFHFWSLHQGGAHFLFADNSVRFLKDCARPVMPALASRAGGETIPDLD